MNKKTLYLIGSIIGVGLLAVIASNNENPYILPEKTPEATTLAVPLVSDPRAVDHASETVNKEETNHEAQNSKETATPTPAPIRTKAPYANDSSTNSMEVSAAIKELL